MLSNKQDKLSSPIQQLSLNLTQKRTPYIKKISRKKAAQRTNKSGPSTDFLNISSTELKEIIAEAIIQSQQIQNENKQKELRKQKDMLREYLYSSKHSCKQISNCSSEKNPPKKTSAENVSKFGIKQFVRYLFIPSEKIKTDFPINSVLKILLYGFFVFAFCSFFLVSFMLFVYPIFKIVNHPSCVSTWLSSFSAWISLICLWSYSIFAFIIGQILRILGNTIDNVTDTNLLLVIFTVITSIISILPTAMTILKMLMGNNL